LSELYLALLVHFVQPPNGIFFQMNVSNINEGNHLHCLHILVSRLFNSKFDANIKVIVFRAVHK
jgi:hypothetical protein